MAHGHRHFVPAAGHDWLLPLYDPLQRLLGAETILRELVAQARIRPGQRVLDIGCGTGNLAVLVKQLHPEADVVGLDPDPKALVRARRKAQRARVLVKLEPGFAEELPYITGSFDRVFSSFMFHHLTGEAKTRALSEVRRVLCPGGSLHVLDFGSPSEGERRDDGFLARTFHSGDHMKDNFEGRIPFFMEDAGFLEPAETAHRSTFLGRIAFYAGRRPGAPPPTA